MNVLKGPQRFVEAFLQSGGIFLVHPADRQDKTAFFARIGDIAYGCICRAETEIELQ